MDFYGIQTKLLERIDETGGLLWEGIDFLEKNQIRSLLGQLPYLQIESGLPLPRRFIQAHPIRTDV